MRCSAEPTDAAVILASWSDPPAFAAVFDRHWVPIHRYCVIRAGSPGPEIAAETFRMTFDIRRRYDGRADAGPWLFGIATDLIQSHFRRSAQVGHAAPSPLAGDREVDPADEAPARIEAERPGAELADVLAPLSAAERDCLLLHVHSGLSNEEIAHATAVPTGTVVSRLGRARARVGAALEHLGERPARLEGGEMDWVRERLPDIDAPDDEITARARRALVAHVSGGAPSPVRAPARALRWPR